MRKLIILITALTIILLGACKSESVPSSVIPPVIEEIASRDTFQRPRRSFHRKRYFHVQSRSVEEWRRRDSHRPSGRNYPHRHISGIQQRQDTHHSSSIRQRHLTGCTDSPKQIFQRNQYPTEVPPSFLQTDRTSTFIEGQVHRCRQDNSPQSYPNRLYQWNNHYRRRTYHPVHRRRSGCLFMHGSLADRLSFDNNFRTDLRK